MIIVTSGWLYRTVTAETWDISGKGNDMEEYFTVSWWIYNVKLPQFSFPHDLERTTFCKPS